MMHKQYSPRNSSTYQKLKLKNKVKFNYITGQQNMIKFGLTHFSYILYNKK